MERIKEIWLLICANRVSSALYIAGVALAVTVSMLVAIVWHVKLSPMYPEDNRARIAYLTQLECVDGTDDDTNTVSWGLGQGTIPLFTDSVGEWTEAIGIEAHLRNRFAHVIAPDREMDGAVKFVNPGFFKVFNYQFLSGSPITEQQWANQEHIAIIDDDMARQLFGSVDAAVGQTVDIDGVQSKITGVVAHGSTLLPTSYGQIFQPYYVQDIADEEYMDSAVGPFQLFFLLRQGAKFSDFKEEMQNRVRRFNAAAESRTLNIKSGPMNHREYAADEIFFGNGNSFLLVFVLGIVLLLVPAFNLSGLILEANHRRNQEQGIRKSFGASKRHLLWQIFVENLALTGIGAAIGLVLAWIVAWACRDWMFDIFSYFGDFESERFVTKVTAPMLFSWRVFAIAVLAALLLNIVSSVLPTWIALRRPIVDQLHDATGRDDSFGFWRRYGGNALVFAEIVLIVLLSWAILDNLTVRTYDSYQPLGYDYDRLVDVTFNSYPAASASYHEEEADSAAHVQSALALMNVLRNMPEVECGTFVKSYTQFEWRGNSSSVFVGSDTTKGHISIDIVAYPYGGDFFATMGIRPIMPEITPAQLDRLPLAPDEVVITRDAALKGYGRIDVVGDSMKSNYQSAFIIRAVVDNVHIKSFINSGVVRFHPDFYNPTLYSDSPWLKTEPTIILRMKEGVRPADFIRSHRDELMQSLKAGNYYCSGLYDFDMKTLRVKNSYGITNTMRVNVILALFLGANVFLGVVGTYYLQTRRRSHEAGLRKSFGATSGRITRSLMAEGMVLTFLAWVIGCVLYWAIVGRHGLTLSMGVSLSTMPDTWVFHYWLHFAVISGIVLIVMLFATLLGISLPAYRISRITPVDALRDE